MQCFMQGTTEMMSFCTLQLLKIVCSTSIGVYIGTTSAAAVDSLSYDNVIFTIGIGSPSLPIARAGHEHVRPSSVRLVCALQKHQSRLTKFGHLNCSSYRHGMHQLHLIGIHNSLLQTRHGGTNVLLL